MKRVGYFMVAAGFLLGAFVTALDVDEVDWTLFVIAASVAVIGLVIYKTQVTAHARSRSVLELNRNELGESIRNIVRDLAEINADTSARGTALRELIDLKLRNDLRRFADARQSMVHLFGLQTYADIMSSFAAGERYVNRVWSASADGYDVEARTYLGKAARQFEDAEKLLSEAAARTA